MAEFREAFDYPFSRLDPTSDHIDPPSVAVYETLLVKGTDGRARPGLASVARVADSGLEWDLRIRDGARFHSGAVCDARAVLESLDALRWQEGDHRQLWYWDPVDRVTVVDNQTLRFTLHHPYRRLSSLLWGTHSAIFNTSAQHADPDAFGVTQWDGTGPFRVQSFDDSRVVATRQDADRHQGVDRVVWVSILDPGDRVAALLTGEVHCLHSPGLEHIAELAGDPRFTVYEEVQPSNMYLSLNWERTDLGFDDVRVRRAISAAVDRDRLVADGVHGHGRATFGPLPPGPEFYDPYADEHGVHDPARASVSLAELGWRPGTDGVLVRDGVRMSFECVIQRDPVFERVAASLVDQLGRIGVELRLRAEVPFADFYRAVERGPDSSISKWLWQDPLDAVIGFTTSSTAPFPNWSNARVPTLDAAYSEWLRAESEDDLVSVAAKAQRIFAAQLPHVPLLSPTDVWVWSNSVRGFEPSPHTLYPRYDHVDA